MSMKQSTNIVKFMDPELGVQTQGRDQFVM